MNKELKEIIKQLEKCKFKCEGGPLENNRAFIKLKDMSNKNIIGTEQLQDEFRGYMNDMQQDGNVFNWEDGKPNTIDGYIKYKKYYIIHNV